MAQKLDDPQVEEMKREAYVQNKRLWKKILILKNNKVKLKVIKHYSKGKIRCACCGQKSFVELTIDHIGGGGNQHRKALGLTVGTQFYQYLIDNHLPKGYQVLCRFCNRNKADYEECGCTPTS